jgi:hypothetical protein
MWGSVAKKKRQSGWQVLDSGFRTMAEARQSAVNRAQTYPYSRSTQYKAGKHRGEYAVFVKQTKANPMKKRSTKKRKGNPGWKVLTTQVSSASDARQLATRLQQLAKRDGTGDRFKAGKSGGRPAVLAKYNRANTGRKAKKRPAKKRPAKKKKATSSPMFRSAVERFNGRDNPGKYRKVKGTGTGWMKADKVRIVKKRGQPDRVEVYRRRAR